MTTTCTVCGLDATAPCHADPRITGCLCRLDSHYVDCSYLGYDLSQPHDKRCECDRCWREALEDTVARNGPEAVRRIEQYDGWDSEGCYFDRGIPEPGMFGQPTPAPPVDWLQTAEDDLLAFMRATKPWFHRLLGWLGHI